MALFFCGFLSWGMCAVAACFMLYFSIIEWYWRRTLLLRWFRLGSDWAGSAYR